jgi:hypothetical protein
MGFDYEVSSFKNHYVVSPKPISSTCFLSEGFIDRAMELPGKQGSKKSISKIKFNPSLFERSEKIYKQRIIDFRKRFENEDILEVYYEDMVKDWEGVLKKTLSFLETPFESLQPTTIKQSPESLSDIFENYEDINKEQYKEYLR